MESQNSQLPKVELYGYDERILVAEELGAIGWTAVRALKEPEQYGHLAGVAVSKVTGSADTGHVSAVQAWMVWSNRLYPHTEQDLTEPRFYYFAANGCWSLSR